MHYITVHFLNLQFFKLKFIRFKNNHVVSTGARGGSKAKITEEIGEDILVQIDLNPFMSLKEMAAYVLGKYNIKCCATTISNFLHGKMLTYKLSRGTVAEKNSERVKGLRRSYLMDSICQIRRQKELIFIDECSFNLWLRCRRGWAKSSDRLYQILPNSRGQNISLVLAISVNGPVHFDIRKGSYTKITYQGLSFFI